MTTTMLTAAELDDDHYPTEATLDTIRTWDGDHTALMDFITPVFERYGTVRVVDAANEISGKTEQRVAISTGGWSGCEDAIAALQQNTMFWLMCWYASKRGGYYEFRIRSTRKII